MGEVTSAASVLMLISGTILGTLAARHVFGKPTSIAFSSLETTLYGLFLAAAYFLALPALPTDAATQTIVFFGAGFAGAFLVGAIVTATGKYGDKREPKTLEELKHKQRAAEEVLKSLLENGFPKTSAKQCLLNCGFSEGVVDNALKKSNDPAPHPLVRRIAALEEKLRRKKK